MTASDIELSTASVFSRRWHIAIAIISFPAWIALVGNFPTEEGINPLCRFEASALITLLALVILGLALPFLSGYFLSSDKRWWLAKFVPLGLFVLACLWSMYPDLNHRHPASFLHMSFLMKPGMLIWAFLPPIGLTFNLMSLSAVKSAADRSRKTLLEFGHMGAIVAVVALSIPWARIVNWTFTLVNYVE